MNNRLMCYYVYINNYKNEDFDAIRSCYSKMVENKEALHIFYEDYIINDDFFIEVEAVYDWLRREETTSEKQEKTELEKICQNIKELWMVESEFEKKVWEILQQASEDHPIIAKLIVLFLTVVLLGLVEDIIYDGIAEQNNKVVINIDKIEELDADGKEEIINEIIKRLNLDERNELEKDRE